MIKNSLTETKILLKGKMSEDEEKSEFESQGTTDPITQTVESKLSQNRETGNTIRGPAFFPVMDPIRISVCLNNIYKTSLPTCVTAYNNSLSTNLIL